VSETNYIKSISEDIIKGAEELETIIRGKEEPEKLISYDEAEEKKPHFRVVHLR
jgi:hypothetical protein